MSRVVAECMALRAWALRALVGETPLGAPPASSPSAWVHFLAVERCALPLSVTLSSLNQDFLSAEVEALLQRARHAELQRVLSAKAQLARLDTIASAHAWDVFLLKGAVAVLGEPHDAVDLADVDILVRPTDAQTLVNALESTGDRVAGPSSPLHLEARGAPGTLPVEVHTGLEILDGKSFEALQSRAIPVSGTERLRRLAPGDHLLHLLTHASVTHPYRRGAIRDLLLVARAVRTCSAAELDEARTRLARHGQAAEMGKVLEMARQLAAQRGAVADPFQYVAGTVFAVSWHGQRLPLPRVLKADVGRWAIALLSGKAERRAEWGKVTMRTLAPSFARPIARVERALPGIGRVVRVASRLLRAVVAIVIAAPLAMVARHEARRAVRAVDS